MLKGVVRGSGIVFNKLERLDDGSRWSRPVLQVAVGRSAVVVVSSR